MHQGFKLCPFSPLKRKLSYYMMTIGMIKRKCSRLNIREDRMAYYRKSGERAEGYKGLLSLEEHDSHCLTLDDVLTFPFLNRVT